MSMGLIVVWSTLIRKGFWRRPMRAITQRMFCKCISMKRPGPRLIKELKEAKTETELVIAVPAAVRVYVVWAMLSYLRANSLVQIDGFSWSPPSQEYSIRGAKQSELHPSLGPESHFSFPNNFPSPQIGEQTLLGHS